jgi:hypothetical protein
VAIEQALQRGPVHLLKRNQPAAVVLSEQHYRQLQRQADQAASPETSALEWLLMQPQASQPRSKASIDAELAAVIAFLDASALMYLLEGEPPWASSVKHELQALADGPLRRRGSVKFGALRWLFARSDLLWQELSLHGAVNQAHVVSEKGFGCKEARHGCLITPVAASREISPCPSARSELRARFLPIDAVLFGQQGEVGVQSCSVELVGGVELHSGAE